MALSEKKQSFKKKGVGLQLGSLWLRRWSDHSLEHFADQSYLMQSDPYVPFKAFLQAFRSNSQ